MTTNIILQAAAGGAAGGWSTIIMLVLIFVVFYFFMVRPQVKKQKEIQKFRSSLSKGDKVITAGGIYGKITSIDTTTVKLEIANDVVVTVDINSVFASSSDSATSANNR